MSFFNLLFIFKSLPQKLFSNVYLCQPKMKYYEAHSNFNPSH
jgi:hypothetical protein